MPNPKLQNLWNQTEDPKSFIESAFADLGNKEYTEEDIIMFLVDAPAKLVDIVEGLVQFAAEQKDALNKVREVAEAF